VLLGSKRKRKNEETRGVRKKEERRKWRWEGGRI
jgi:hypothetical protein